MARNLTVDQISNWEEIYVSSEVVFYTIADVCKMTGWSHNTVEKLFNDKKFPAANYGRGKVVESHALIRFFAVRREKALDNYWNPGVCERRRR